MHGLTDPLATTIQTSERSVGIMPCVCGALGRGEEGTAQCDASFEQKNKPTAITHTRRTIVPNQHVRTNLDAVHEVGHKVVVERDVDAVQPGIEMRDGALRPHLVDGPVPLFWCVVWCVRC